MYLNEPYVLSGYACFYQNQDNSVNISSAALENLGDMRKVNKKKMEAAEHGSDEYVYYRILQLTYKVLMNSYYGILGEKNSVFYNPFVQNSITMTGQDLITTTIIGMENFLSNNVLFEDTDDVITFITNIKEEEKKYFILDYIDEPITEDELYNYLITHVKPNKTVDMRIIRSYVEGLDAEMLSRVFYKNQIKVLLQNNSWFRDNFKEILEYEFIDKPADEVAEKFESLKEKILDFVYYDYLYEDRYKRAVKDKRRSVITIDTDSVFNNVNPHVELITELLGLDPNNEAEQSSIVNILINITTAALGKIFWTLTTNMGLVERAKPLINMKQEFLYQRLLLTKNKKNYAGIITAELGHKLSRPVLDIKGLPILKKTSVPKALRKQFTKLVEEDILKANKINLKQIIDKYDNIELMIEDSISKGNIEFLLPKNLELIESYKTPDTIEAVRGVLIWNACEPENQIIPPEKINLIKLNGFEPTDPRFEDLKKNYPDKYNAIMKTVFNYNVTNPKIDISRFGLSCIAMPKSEEKIPEYLMPFIDYKTMVNTNMAPSFILLESLGIYCEEVKTVKYKSNIISI